MLDENHRSDAMHAPQVRAEDLTPGAKFQTPDGEREIVRTQGSTIKLKAPDGGTSFSTFSKFLETAVPVRLPAAQPAAPENGQDASERLPLIASAIAAQSETATSVSPPAVDPVRECDNWPRKLARIIALALRQAAWLSIIVLVANWPDGRVLGRSSLLYKLADALCSIVWRPAHRWAEVATMLAITIGLPLMLLELATEIEDWAAAQSEAAERWFWNEPCFFCGKPAGAGALQEVDTFALVCPVCRRLNRASVTAGRLAQVGAWLSGALLAWGLYSLLLGAVLRPLDRVSGWWSLSIFPLFLLCVGLALWVSFRMVFALLDLAEKVPKRQPDSPDFVDGRFRWRPRWNGGVPQRAKYGVPIQLPRYDLRDFSPAARVEWEKAHRRAWEVRSEFPKLLDMRWPDQTAKDWTPLPPRAE